jgi:hypothetical protein
MCLTFSTYGRVQKQNNSLVRSVTLTASCWHRRPHMHAFKWEFVKYKYIADTKVGTPHREGPRTCCHCTAQGPGQLT